MFDQMLKAARLNLGLSQEELAHKLKVSARTVSRWECGDVKPSAPAIAIFAVYLNRAPQGYMVAFPASIAREYKRLSIKAGGKINNDVKHERLPRPNTLGCSDCSNTARIYDHRDYLAPLDIEPVCDGCNSHRGMAINTLLAHEDYWQSFDWNEPPAQERHPQWKGQTDAVRNYRKDGSK